jgi:undecaprenyl-diphosphatase
MARLVTLLGETPVVWTAVGSAALCTGWRTRSWAAGAVPVVTLAAGAGTRRLLAQVLGRPRPPRRLWRSGWSGASFPSRHTTLAVLGTGLAAEGILGRAAADRAARSVGVAVAVSRLVLGVHWPTDVLAGWAFGATVLTVRRRYGHRFHRRGGGGRPRRRCC